MIHIATACVIGLICFFAGLVAMGIAKNELYERMRLKLTLATIERDRLQCERDELADLVERRADEVMAQRGARGLFVVEPEGGPEEAE